MDKTYNSRWDDSLPAVRNGRKVIVTPSEAELTHVFPVLDRRLARNPWSYDILPLNYIHALVSNHFKSTAYLGDRLPLLCRPPNQYLRRPESQTANLKANSRFQVYAHGD